MPAAMQPLGLSRATATERRSRGALRFVAVTVVAVIAGAWMVASMTVRAGAVPMQVGSSTTLTVTTSENLLVGSTTTSTTEKAPTTVVSGRAQKAANDDTRSVWYIVAGLVAVAVALIALTAFYWRRTRPRPLGQSEPDPAR